MSKKWHYPSPLNRPICSRLLSGHRPEQAQNQSTMRLVVAENWAGLKPKLRCRHCQRELGELAPVSREARMSMKAAELLVGLGDTEDYFGEEQE